MKMMFRDNVAEESGGWDLRGVSTNQIRHRYIQPFVFPAVQR